jgi:hypothetical protein
MRRISALARGPASASEGGSVSDSRWVEVEGGDVKMAKKTAKKSAKKGKGKKKK